MFTNPWVGLYESFAARAFGGNVAGVVVSADPLSEHEMQGIASDLLAPTTGFVSHSSMAGRHVPTRFFTPTQEIDACGHVTIAVAQAVADLELVAGSGAISIVCDGGDFEVSRLGSRLSMAQTARVLPTPAPISLDELASVLGRTPIDANVAGTGLTHLFVEFADLDDLSHLRLDHAALAALGASVGVDTIGVFSRLEGDRVRLRDLTAPIGVLEEPASGTTSGALGLLVGAPALTVEQGFEMGRPSLIDVIVDEAAVSVSGTARRVMSGELDPPD